MNETLLKAAEYIDQKGWTKDELDDDLGRVCLYGAIGMVTEPKRDNMAFLTAKQHLRQFVEQVREIPFITKDGYDNVIYLNDFRLTSAEEASKVLREAAEWTPND